MSIFTKPLAQLGTQDLQDLLDRQAVENVRLEFKREYPDKDEMLKKLSSFANTYGGIMIIGAAASNDGRITTLSGVEPQSGYRQKVIDWCFDGASPPLTVSVSEPIPVPSGGDKVCHIISAPESDLAPHFLNGRKGVYIRSDEFSKRFEPLLANEAELRHLSDRRKGILGRRAELLNRSRLRFRTHVEQRRKKPLDDAPALSPSQTPTPETPRSYVEISIAPTFPVRQVCEQHELPRLIGSHVVPWCGTGFPLHIGEYVSHHESILFLDPFGTFSLLEANVWGMLFYANQISESHYTGQGQHGPVAIHRPQFIGEALVALHHAAAVLPAFGHSGPLVVEMALRSITGVPWLSFQHRAFASYSDRPQLDDEVAFSVATTSDLLRETPDELALDLLRYAFFAAGFSRIVERPQDRRNLLSEGYDYNHWRQKAAGV